MKLYSYIVTHDTGFSPNPFWGYCTLANCKPAIRRAARAGDWIVGISPKAQGNRLIYAMQVEEIVPYETYYQDPRFAAKIPDYTKQEIVCKCGDNIYRPLPDGNFQQLRSVHSNGPHENLDTKHRDLGGRNVLVSKRFYYFGSEALELPEKLEALKVGRAHRCRFFPEVISDFLAFIAEYRPGIHGPPSSWPADDTSWSPSSCENRL